MKYLFFILIYFNLLLSNDLLQTNLTINEKNWIKNNTIIVGVEQFEPLVYSNDGTDIDGITGDILNIIAEKFNLNIKIVNKDWSSLLKDFKNGKIDLLPATYYTKQRATYGLYSKEYFKIKEYIYIRNNSKIQNFDDLKNKKIAIIKDYGTIPKIRAKYPSIKIVETKNMEESVNFLLEKKVSALVDAQISIENFIAKNVIVGINGISQNVFEASSLHFFSNKKKIILQTILQKGLNSISKFQYNKIVLKWLHAENKKNKNILKLTSDEQNYLKDKKILNLCVDPDWMPFDGIKNGKHTGLSSDYMKLISDMIKVPIKLIKTSSWNDTLTKAQNRQCDIISIISKTKQKEQYLNFTNPYIDLPIVIATRKDKLYIDDIMQIIDKKLAVIGSSSITTYLKNNYKDIKIVNVASIKKGLEAVENGKVYAYIDNLASIHYEINKNFIGTLNISGRIDKRIKYGSATRSDEPLLNTIVSKAIANINNETRFKIFNKWSKSTIIVKTDYTLLKEISVLFTVFLLLLFYRQINLKKHANSLKSLNDTLEFKVNKAVDEVREKEKILYRQSRHAQMGEMISMIAHQWRQPLSAISSKSAAISTKAKLNKLDNDKAIELSSHIIEYTLHLSQTIDDFRNFFKINKEIVLTTLDNIVFDAIRIIRPNLDINKINLVKNLNSKVKFEIYENEIKQVILNLIKNAEDALLERKVNNPMIKVTTYINHNTYILEVEDNAGGISNDIIDNIFDPYFSTKMEKDGTGLGLYMSKTIIEDHCKGKLTVSNNNDGAIFKIILKDKNYG